MLIPSRCGIAVYRGGCTAAVTEGTAKASATETEELNTEHYPETIPCPLLVIDALGVTNWGCPLYSQEMELMEEQQLAELLW